MVLELKDVKEAMVAAVAEADADAGVVVPQQMKSTPGSLLASEVVTAVGLMTELLELSTGIGHSLPTGTGAEGWQRFVFALDLANMPLEHRDVDMVFRPTAESGLASTAVTKLATTVVAKPVQVIRQQSC